MRNVVIRQEVHNGSVISALFSIHLSLLESGNFGLWLALWAGLGGGLELSLLASKNDG